MDWQTFFAVTGLLKDASLHFWFSAFAGLLVFALIVTISYGVYRNWTGIVFPSIAGRTCILGLALCCAFLAAFTCHCYIDGAVAWWVAPIDPPLVIVR